MNRNNQSNDRDQTFNQPPRRQLIPEKGEEYLRESANIEGMPSPAEEAEAEKTLREESPQNWFRV